jgi:hydrogenase nickel incorporation protein HypB
MKKPDPGKSILSANDEQARKNLQRLEALHLAAVNVMASPGAGKTSLIVQLLKHLPENLSRGVIEGDVAGSIDTDYIRSLGFPATQINTGGGCHLTASMVEQAITTLGLAGPGLLFIENIGNLICPAAYRLGERIRVLVSSVPEGDDKPRKYPAMFAQVDAIILNKIDLLAHLDFNEHNFQAGVRVVNETAPIFRVSCRTAEGIDTLAEWLRQLTTTRSK